MATGAVPEERLVVHSERLATAVNKIEDAKAHIDKASDYLRHSLWSDLKEEDTNGYCCACHLIGGKCEHEHTWDKKDSFHIFLTAEQSVRAAVKEVQGLVEDLTGVSGGTASNTGEDSASSAPDVGATPTGAQDAESSAPSDESKSKLSAADVKLVYEELDSMIELASITQNEFNHYAKHLVRGWWQDRKLRQLKESLVDDPSHVIVVLDHKNKIPPGRNNEPMSDYFQKKGMSLLGCMLMRGAKRGQLTGLEVFFIDIVMRNTNTQEARDVMPCLEAVLKILANDEIFRRHEMKKLTIVSDGAGGFASTVHTPYIDCLNGILKDHTAKIVEWFFTEPQLGKDFLDAHFAFINIQLRKAMIAGDIAVYNQEDLARALRWNEGIRATVTVLLEEDKAKGDIVKKECDKLSKAFKVGINTDL